MTIINTHFDWLRVARLLLISREIDRNEEAELYPKKQIAYQFSAGGHELAQILLGSLLNQKHDAASAYYRSRPLLLSLGLSIEEAFAGPLGRSGGISDGRDIGVVFNLPSNADGVTVLPMAGDVGAQYTPAAGWAEAIRYHREVLHDSSYEKSISVVLGGEGSVATNGFWSALILATTLDLPLLFFIEDNGYAISVPADKQTPGGNIAENLLSYKNLRLFTGDGVNPAEAAQLIFAAVNYVRSAQKPALIRLVVPRLSGHSGQDSQAYKPNLVLETERSKDPLNSLKQYLVPAVLTEASWESLVEEVEQDVAEGLELALARGEPDPEGITSFVFSEEKRLDVLAESNLPSPSIPQGTRINMLEGIRRTLETELAANPKMLIFGEDVGVKGGVHAVTMGLQERFGVQRVYDTSLSEEGIIGRAIGMSLSGLFPVPEIQFRKYADAAAEQLNNCGTIRWRTANRFSAPMVVRLAGGFSRRAGDPWHSMLAESAFAHAVGWRVVMPANAEDAVGLLRSALRGEDPTIFFEHRALLDAPWARRPYPGDDYILPIGKAKIVQEGEEITVVSWGAMLERCEAAISEQAASVELIDLRTILPWDKAAVLRSVKKTGRCILVHEDGFTAGFGAEIAAVLAAEAFHYLKAPVLRLAPPDIPIPYNPILMEAVLPGAGEIAIAVRRLINY